jgi:hypothetical protein
MRCPVSPLNVPLRVKSETVGAIKRHLNTSAVTVDGDLMLLRGVFAEHRSCDCT